MKTITELLRDADPLLHESTASSEERDCRRKAILAAATGSHDGALAEPRSRVTLILALSLVVIVLVFLAGHMWSPLSDNVYAAAVRFEVKLAEDKPAAGFRETKIPGTDRVVYLPDEDVITNSDISRAYIIQADRSSQYKVGVEFNSVGTEKIRVATAGQNGKPMAILLDGQVVMIAVVREPIGKSAVISGDLSKTRAERIVKGITIPR